MMLALKISFYRSVVHPTPPQQQQKKQLKKTTRTHSINRSRILFMENILVSYQCCSMLEGLTFSLFPTMDGWDSIVINKLSILRIE